MVDYMSTLYVEPHREPRLDKCTYCKKPIEGEKIADMFLTEQNMEYRHYRIECFKVGRQITKEEIEAGLRWLAGLQE